MAARSTTVLLAVQQQPSADGNSTVGFCVQQQGTQQQQHHHQEPALQPFALSRPGLQQQQHHNQQQQHQQQQQQQLPFFSCLLAQLDALGWHRVAQLAPDLSQLTLQLRDAAGRRHLARVQLPASFPVGVPQVAMQLPAPFKPRWRPGDSLASLAAQAEQALDSHQALWEQLEDLDAHTQVLDPPAALARPYAHCGRCVALGNGASCQLALAPAAPTALPAGVVFHGPSAAVAGLQSCWYGAVHTLWREQASVRANLEAVLQLRLPPPKPSARKGCAAASAVPGAAVAPEGLQLPPPAAGAAPPGAGGGAGVGELSSDMDEGEEEEELGLAPGACAICYALHLADPARPDELGDVAAATTHALRPTCHLRLRRAAGRRRRPCRAPGRRCPRRDVPRRHVRPRVPRIMPGRVAGGAAKQPARV